jgi:Undecaprenyl-phosphate glucose phosphotransferase
MPSHWIRINNHSAAFAVRGITKMKPGTHGLAARLVDMVLIGFAAVLSLHIRFPDTRADHTYAICILISIALTLIVFPASGIYQSWRGRSAWKLVSRVALIWLAVQVCSLALMFSLHITDFLSRLWMAYWTGLGGALLISARLGIYGVLRRVRKAGHNLRKVAVIGTAAQCARLLKSIQDSPGSGFRPSAAFPVCSDGAGLNIGVPVFSGLEAFAQHVRAGEVHELWLALSLSEEPVVTSIVKAFRSELVNIRLIPDVSSLAPFGGTIVNLLGAPAISLVGSPLTEHAMFSKDLFDRAFAALALIAIAPLLMVIAIAVKLSSRGPVLFMQRRKGADGRVFKIYKFRSMYVHAPEPGVVKQATKGDPRITRLGAFLRRTSLDELPQLMNVLRGEMSVVGPRPHAIEHDEIYRTCVDDYLQRYRIKPGITGWAQVNGYRGETDQIEKMQRRVELDLYYLKNWSFWLDVRIVLATVAKGFVSANAY